MIKLCIHSKTSIQCITYMTKDQVRFTMIFKKNTNERMIQCRPYILEKKKKEKESYYKTVIVDICLYIVYIWIFCLFVSFCFFFFVYFAIGKIK